MIIINMNQYRYFIIFSLCDTSAGECVERLSGLYGDVQPAPGSVGNHYLHHTITGTLWE